MEKLLNQLLSNQQEFFRFMKEKYPIFFNSNIFLRDIQYGVYTYFDMKGNKLKYFDAENIAVKFMENLENENKLIKLSHNTWKVNFSIDEFVKLENITLENSL